MEESKWCHPLSPIGPIIVFQLGIIIGILIAIFLELEESEEKGPRPKK